MNTRTIEVTGRGSVAARPDLIRLHLTVTRRAPCCEDAVADAQEDARRLTQALCGAGIETRNVHAHGLRVAARYENEQTPAGRYVRTFAGYEAVRRLTAEFPAESGLLGAVLTAAAADAAAPELHIEYALSDPQAARDEALARAAADGRRRAEILAAATGARLGALLSVRHGGAAPLPAGRTAAFSARDGMAEPEPETIEIGDSATLTWELL